MTFDEWLYPKPPQWVYITAQLREAYDAGRKAGIEEAAEWAEWEKPIDDEEAEEIIDGWTRYSPIKRQRPSAIKRAAAIRALLEPPE